MIFFNWCTFLLAIPILELLVELLSKIGIFSGFTCKSCLGGCSKENYFMSSFSWIYGSFSTVTNYLSLLETIGYLNWHWRSTNHVPCTISPQQAIFLQFLHFQRIKRATFQFSENYFNYESVVLMCSSSLRLNLSIENRTK